ncbi:MAG: hypothetical protein ACRDYB_06405 [Acidimicrobiales bacterium]
MTSGRRLPTVVFVAGSVALAAAVAESGPFTTAADLFTALGLAYLAIEAGTSVTRPVTATGPPVAAGARWWPWLALAAVVVAFELVSYLLSPRVDHPTLSSLYDSATTWPALRGGAFFGWMMGGLALSRR